MKATRECSVDGCDLTPRAKGLCDKHYKRMWRTGSPTGSIPRLKQRACDVEGCGAQVKARGLCANHYARQLRGQDPHVPPVLSGPRSWKWAPRDSLDYDAMHERLKQQRGRAREYMCICCGERAQEWAYQHTDPEPLVSQHGCLYTDDVMAYEPMCRTCHRAYDRSMRDKMLQQQRGEAS